MEQPTPTKPVMDVMPPKPVATPATPVLPPTDSDSAKLPSASASLEQVGPRTDTVAGDAKEGPELSQALAEHIGKATDAAGPAADTGKDSLAVHAAPPLSDDDKASAEAQKNDAASAKPEKKPTAHTAPSKPRGPAGAITLVILGMVVLSALAILVYLNS